MPSLISSIDYEISPSDRGNFSSSRAFLKQWAHLHTHYFTLILYYISVSYWRPLLIIFDIITCRIDFAAEHISAKCLPSLQLLYRHCLEFASHQFQFHYWWWVLRHCHYSFLFKLYIFYSIEYFIYLFHSASLPKAWYYSGLQNARRRYHLLPYLIFSLSICLLVIGYYIFAAFDIAYTICVPPLKALPVALYDIVGDVLILLMPCRLMFRYYLKSLY